VLYFSHLGYILISWITLSCTKY